MTSTGACWKSLRLQTGALLSWSCWVSLIAMQSPSPRCATQYGKSLSPLHGLESTVDAPHRGCNYRLCKVHVASIHVSPATCTKSKIKTGERHTSNRVRTFRDTDRSTEQGKGMRTLQHIVISWQYQTLLHNPLRLTSYILNQIWILQYLSLQRCNASIDFVLIINITIRCVTSPLNGYTL